MLKKLLYSAPAGVVWFCFECLFVLNNRVEMVCIKREQVPIISEVKPGSNLP